MLRCEDATEETTYTWLVGTDGASFVLSPCFVTAEVSISTKSVPPASSATTHLDRLARLNHSCFCLSGRASSTAESHVAVVSNRLIHYRLPRSRHISCQSYVLVNSLNQSALWA